MTRWVAIFEDNPEPEVGWVRQRHAEEHFTYLAEHRSKILLGGGLRHAPGEWYCGGMWVMEVGSREEAVGLCENDPFYKQEALQSVCMGQSALLPDRRGIAAGCICGHATPTPVFENVRQLPRPYCRSARAGDFWRSTMPTLQSCHGSL